MILKRIGPMSLAKVSGIMYAVIGFVVGCIFALFSMLGGALSERPAGQAFGAFFGVGAVILFPILYGVLGFVGSLIGAALYNLFASLVGGIEMDFEPRTPGVAQAPVAAPAPGPGPMPGA